MNLKEIAQDVKTYEGLLRKKGIGNIFRHLREVSNFGDTFIGLGDDAAVIQEDDSFLLLAADSIWKPMLSVDPYAAGRASVIVNVNDIVATGGKPIAMVNVISCPTDYDLDSLLMGINEACKQYRVAMVGGHYHPDADSPELSVAILGRATKLLTSHTAKAGQNIIVAIDLNGQRGTRFLTSWDSTLNKSPEEIWDKLGVIIQMAEDELAATAKDISNPGVLGSLATLLFASHKGANVIVENIPRPNTVSLTDWLRTYPSYGFILCVDKRNTDRCVASFEARGIAANVVGQVQDGAQVILHYAGQQEMLFDFEKDSLY